MFAATRKAKSNVQTRTYDVVNVANADSANYLGDVVAVGPSERGVDVMVDKLRDRVRWNGRIKLLRIHGAGGPNFQVLSCESSPQQAELAASRAAISCDNFEFIRPSLARLRGCFASGAMVVLLGCESADTGSHLVDMLAELWGVVVTTRSRNQVMPVSTISPGNLASPMASVI